MLFRAIFWIGLVAVLMPRAPDLHAEAAAASVLGSAASQATGGASGSLANFQTLILDRLVQIRSDIEAQQRVRAGQ